MRRSEIASGMPTVISESWYEFTGEGGGVESEEIRYYSTGQLSC
jgi:hypothetical protein